MNYNTFILSLKNNWNSSHKIIQEIDNKIASWIHAYLHRLEGDMNNANYWYKKAAKTPTNESLKREAKNIICFLHDKKSSMID